LGLNTNVAEMTKEYAQSTATVAEDKQAVSFLKSEAESMKSMFEKQIDDFVTVCIKAGVQPSTLGTLHKLLTSTRSVCMDLELQLGNLNQALFDRFSPEESAPMTIMTNNPILEITSNTTDGNGDSNGEFICNEIAAEPA